MKGGDALLCVLKRRPVIGTVEKYQEVGGRVLYRVEGRSDIGISGCSVYLLPVAILTICAVRYIIFIDGTYTCAVLSICPAAVKVKLHLFVPTWSFNDTTSPSLSCIE